MTREQKDIALVSLLLAWTSSWTNSWIASREITMMMVIRSRDSSPFTTAQWCLFNANQKKAFEQIVKFYNEHCVWRGCRKCPFHRYWKLIIPWLNKQTGCIAFPMKESTNPLSSQTLISFFSLFWKSCWTNRWVFLIRNLNLCEQSVICQVQLNYDLMLSTTDDQDPVISYDLNFGHDVFAINTV